MIILGNPVIADGTVGQDSMKESLQFLLFPNSILTISLQIIIHNQHKNNPLVKLVVTGFVNWGWDCIDIFLLRISLAAVFACFYCDLACTFHFVPGNGRKICYDYNYIC